MSAPISQNGSKWISIAVAIVLTIGCALLRMQLHGSDNYLFNRLLTVLSVQERTGFSSNLLLELVLSAVEVGSAFAIGLKLSILPRPIATAQLYVVSMMAQGLIYNAAGKPGEPLSSALAVATGLLSGYVFRRLRIRDEKFESQYYEIELRNRELQEARLMLVKQDEVERRMLAADLHDQVLNDLKTLKQEIDSLVIDSPNEASERVEKLLAKTMSDIREVMDSLCPSTLEHLGLAASIEDCARRSAQRAGFRVRFKSSADEQVFEKLSVVERSLLYRLAQESLTNVCKHAQAARVQVNIRSEDNALCIAIIDDGKGLPPNFIPNESRGLRYMRLRADLIGARVTWGAGEEDKGTAVNIRMELSNNGHSNSNS